jgi:hypothetical protein
MIKIIALDLEGTLISNAMSQIPRPGLFEFLIGCKSITERVVIYTTIKEKHFRDIADILVSEGTAPIWFSTIEYVIWEGRTKDLSFIPNNELCTSVLVDDFKKYVHKGQESQWVEITQFKHPYPDDDNELKVILNRLISMCA